MPTRYLWTILLSLALCQLSVVAPAWALITGGEGNEPVNDPGWPKGAEKIFNHEGRAAWWEGPPFGGGQWHAECRADTAAFNKVLEDFAKLDVKTKRLVVHDGVGRSFWLNPNGEEKKAEAAKIDWIFMVWQQANWERLRTLPAEFAPPRAEGEDSPPAQIDAYTDGSIRWADVKVPKGIEVIDQRLEAHGYKATDGVVLEGVVTDLATQKPLTATIVMEKMESQAGGYHYTPLKAVTTNDQGAWVIKNAPPGRYRLCAQAEGYVARVIAHGQSDDQPRWQRHAIALAKPATVTGKINDESGKPLADVQVRLSGVMADSQRYESTQEYSIKTRDEGTFVLENLPCGTASIWVHKEGYCCPGLGPSITIPAKEVQLTMLKSARLKITVGFGAAKRPEGYVVHLEPAGGAGVGMWSGSGNIDQTDQITFENVPPGSYVLKGQPNPGREGEQTEPIAVELKSGQSRELVLTAK